MNRGETKIYPFLSRYNDSDLLIKNDEWQKLINTYSTEIVKNMNPYYVYLNVDTIRKEIVDILFYSPDKKK